MDFFFFLEIFRKAAKKGKTSQRPETIYIRMNIQAQFSAPLLPGRRVRRIAAMTSNFEG